MNHRGFLSIAIASLLCTTAGCGADRRAGRGAPDLGPVLAPTEPPPDLGTPPAPTGDLAAPFDRDAACAVATAPATVEYAPVDIIWVVDNSTSMKPAIDEITAGLNAFAALIAGKSLDYKIIMLSLRSKTNPTTVGGSNRYGVCIPPPLAGNADCGDGPRFFQSSIDVRSTQPLEQLLGTLGQTDGYAATDARGGAPWRQELRPNATKTIVVVSDDNSRLGADQFERFAGGKNPFNTLTLPPGLLDASWNGLFTDYTFAGLYGWGSTTDAAIKCTFSDGTQPSASGKTYTDLVTRTNGVRAKICDGAGAWTGFFDAIAQAVARTARVSCDLAIPPPPPGVGAIDPAAINVSIEAGGSTLLYKVPSQAACGAAGGWSYDDDAHPTRVLLCPASCATAQQKIAANAGGQIAVQFGCQTQIL